MSTAQQQQNAINSHYFKENRPLSLGLGVTTAGLRHSIRAIRDPQPPFSAGPGAGAGFRRWFGKFNLR
jgi:hypothetical protein